MNVFDCAILVSFGNKKHSNDLALYKYLNKMLLSFLLLKSQIPIEVYSAKANYFKYM